MARGQPDFGLYAPKTVAASVSDMGEIATRLGSIDVYDKRGDVVLLDTFEDPVMKWIIGGTVTGNWARLDQSNPKFGSQSLKLHTINAADESVEVLRWTSILASKRLGNEFAFSKLSTNLNLYVYYVYYSGTQLIDAEVRLDPVALTLAVQTTGGAYAPVASIGALVAQNFYYYHLKLVADFDTQKYVRLLYGATEYDISDIPLRVRNLPFGQQVRVGAWAENRAALGGDVWLDNFIFTQEEP